MKRLLLLLMTATVLFACTDGLDEGRPKASLEASQAVLDAGGGAIFIRVKAEGDWSLQLMEGKDWGVLSTVAGRGDRNNVLLTYPANPDAAPRRLTMELLCGKESAFLALNQMAGTPEPEPGPDPDVPGGMPTTVIPKWLELPATSVEDGLDFFARPSVSLNAKQLRNYAYYWNYTDRVAAWVAYPLCSAYLGSSGRTEEWGYDPLMPASKQQNVSGGYREGNNGWYARGHQIPSADRTFDRVLNATTFYGTNMTPQNNDFNSGVWAVLEGKVRDWATKSDTLYVVTGCVVDGAKYYVLDRSGNKITVPTAYFKAVLRYQKNSTIGHNGYMATAFWYNHENFPNAFTKNECMSVARLEEKLGYNLFVNLPGLVGDAVAAEIETENPSAVSWWWQ